MSDNNNLIVLSSDKAREYGRKGGKAAGIAKRKKRDMKACAELLLSLQTLDPDDYNLLNLLGVNFDSLPPEEITNLLIVNAALVLQAKKGDVASIKELRNVIQDDYYLNQKAKNDRDKLKLEKQRIEKPAPEPVRYAGIPATLIAPAFAGTLIDIADHEHTEYTFPGGRGSCKSSFCGISVVDLIMQHDDMHACVLRQVGNTIKDSVYNQIQWAITALGLDSEFTTTKSPFEFTRISTGQKIYFRGADDPNKIKSIKPPFGYIGIIWFEELDQFHGDEAIRKIEQSVIRGGDIAYKFKSFNPPKSANNWANMYVKIPKLSMLVTESSYLTVPKKWLGESFLEDAEYLKTANPIAYDNEYLGIANGTGGNVFDNVRIAPISDEEIGQFDRIYNGLDWGWYPDPFAFVRCHYDAARLTLYIWDEYRAKKLSNAETADALKARGITGNDVITCDSAEPKSISEYRSYGLMARAAEKGPGSVDFSTKWLQSLKEIVIDNTRCPETALEFISYEYDRDKEGHVISGYPDANNHSIDAVRYAMNSVIMRRTVRTGDVRAVKGI